MAALAPHGQRIVHHGDGVAWLEAADLSADCAIVTSLPDHSELPALGVEGWREWFVSVTALACEKVADEAVAIFFQTDVKHEGRWIDKGYLVSRGAERAGSHLLWHKVVCRTKPGTVTFGRPAYAHLLCFSRSLCLGLEQSSADVLPSLGEMIWARAMGAAVCDRVASFLLAHTACRTVLDPFCGQGTMLAVANARGLDAVGVESSRKRVKKARALTLARPSEHTRARSEE